MDNMDIFFDKTGAKDGWKHGTAVWQPPTGEWFLFVGSVAWRNSQICTSRVDSNRSLCQALRPPRAEAAVFKRRVLADGKEDRSTDRDRNPKADVCFVFLLMFAGCSGHVLDWKRTMNNFFTCRFFGGVETYSVRVERHCTQWISDFSTRNLTSLLTLDSTRHWSNWCLESRLYVQIWCWQEKIAFRFQKRNGAEEVWN